MHGAYALERSRDIIFINAEGPWNLECAKHYQKAYGKLISDTGRAFAELLILSGEGLFIPEVYEKLAKALDYSKSKGLSYVAVVFEECLTERTTRNQFLDFYQRLGIEVEFFADRHDAYRWLREEKHCQADDLSSLV